MNRILALQNNAGRRVLTAQNYVDTGVIGDIVNDRDVLLQSTYPRTSPAADRLLLLLASESYFWIASNGAISPASITFTPVLLGMTGTIAYGVSSGATLTFPGGVPTLNYGDMSGEACVVTASITVDGITYSSQPVKISKERDGAAEITPDTLLTLLEDKISKSQLNADLRSTIEIVDGPASNPSTVQGRVKAETDARVAAITKEAADRVTYVQQYTYSKTESDNSLSVFATTVATQYKAYADGVGGAAVSSATAYVQNYAYSKSMSDSALSAMANTLRSEFATTNGVTTGYLNQYYYTQAQTNSAISSATTTLSTTVGQNTSTLQTQATTINGLSAQYTVKTDINGYVTGFGLASSAAGATPTSAFIINAGAFSFVFPGTAPQPVFTIGKVNGQTKGVLRGDLIADGSITTSMLVVGGSPDNIIPDPQFRDLSWWGRAGIASAAQWADQGQITGWSGGSSLYLGLGDAETDTNIFQMTPGATYLISIQVSITNDWNGRLGVYFLVPGITWYPMIQGAQVQATGQTWPNGLPVSINANNPTKGQITCSSLCSIPPAGTTANTRIKIISSFTAGSCEIGSLSATRVVDSTLIGPGSVQTKHLSIATGGDISSGQTSFDLGNGFWLEGVGNGHGARFSIGNSSGKKIICDPQNNILGLFNVDITNPGLAQKTITGLYNVLGMNGVANGTKQGLGTQTASMSNSAGAVNYVWSAESSNGTITLAPSGSSCAIYAQAQTNGRCQGTVYCTGTDGSGFSAPGSIQIDVGFGSGVAA